MRDRRSEKKERKNLFENRESGSNEMVDVGGGGMRVVHEGGGCPETAQDLLLCPVPHLFLSHAKLFCQDLVIIRLLMSYY